MHVHFDVGLKYPINNGKFDLGKIMGPQSPRRRLSNGMEYFSYNIKELR
jgi:hypothetical protein